MKPTKKHQPIALPPLSHCAALANEAIDAITKKEDGFARDTLQERLAIGLACMKAHAVFAATNPGKRGQGRKINSRREEIKVPNPKSNKTPRSFTEWLERDLPRLKEPVAYKYMKAAAGLGLEPVGLDDCDIPILLKRWEKDHGTTATLSALIAANTLALDAGRSPAGGGASDQTEFEFFKECASSARAACESVCAIKAKLPEDFKRALSAQFYAALYELTGTHWSPSDEAPELANVDPASIKL